MDYDLWLRMSEDHLIRVIPEPLYCSRQPEQRISAIRAEEQRRCAESTRERARESRVFRVLHDFDDRLITLEQATDSVTTLGREEEIGRLEQQRTGSAVELLTNRLRRSSGFGRWIWAPPRRPIGIQRWTPRRISALVAVIGGAALVARLIALNLSIVGRLL